MQTQRNSKCTKIPRVDSGKKDADIQSTVHLNLPHVEFQTERGYDDSPDT